MQVKYIAEDRKGPNHLYTADEADMLLLLLLLPLVGAPCYRGSGNLTPM